MKKHVAKASARATADLTTEGAWALFLAKELSNVANLLKEQNMLWAIIPELDRAIAGDVADEPLNAEASDADLADDLQVELQLVENNSNAVASRRPNRESRTGLGLDDQM